MNTGGQLNLPIQAETEKEIEKEGKTMFAHSSVHSCIAVVEFTVCKDPRDV